MVTVRSVYELLLRLHPGQFRKQFQDQMMCTFDDSVESRGSASLILDAVLSLIRQWALHPRYWLNGSRIEISADAPVDFVEWILQIRKAKVLYRKARLLNFAWVIGVFLVVLIFPLPLERKGFILLWCLQSFSLIGIRERERIRKESRDNLSLAQDSHQTYRRWTEAKRDGLRRWSVSLTSPLNPGTGTLIILSFMSLVGLFTQYVRHSEIDQARLWVFFAGTTILAGLLFLLRRVNQNAVQAFQRAIDTEPERVTGVARAIFER
jgi:hypothetical protein